MERNIYKIGKELFITSDEEIKGGDWCYHPLLKWGSVIKSKYDEPNSTMKKIILTTDQELIKDGVQAIDDEFLEWFVKNPSCEYIEIENVYDKFLNSGKRSVSDFRKKYKIIIPKEESKQCELCKRYPRLEGTNKCESCYSVVRHVLEQDPRFKDTLLPDLRKKLETLEEAAENYGWRIKTNSFSDNVKANELAESSKQDFIEGAKWQAERMYSEEEVKNIISKLIRDCYYMQEPNQDVAEWFEQFKKEVI